MRSARLFRWLFMLVILSMLPFSAFSQEDKQKEKPVYTFTIDHVVKRTPVKNQYHTGTCWSFSTVSFLESELLRLGKEEMDLSEMFVVRNTYPLKAQNYIRLHGNATFGEGALSHDAINQIRLYGIVPENVYPGLKIGEKRHNHGEMYSVLKAMLDAVLKQNGKKVTPRWLDAFDAVLDVYLGTPPKEFKYKGKTYTAKSFLSDYLQLDLDQYIEFTSLTHHPFYQKCRVEIPDNWSCNDNYFNVPLDDLEKIADYALTNGNSFVWDGDVSERNFSSRKTGYGIVPLKDWEDKTEAEKKVKITEPVAEKVVTQQLHQQAFNNFTTTDDHLMHVVGLAHDQNGNKFYYTKNSGGTDRKYDGYVYLSRAYFRLKIIGMMVHKDAVPPDIKARLNL
ncbi:MAG TPA: aminopeptidase [Bacteroidetes bacterium]|nr:aminopeptidase [Bacteroidota bacterium]